MKEKEPGRRLPVLGFRVLHELWGAFRHPRRKQLMSRTNRDRPEKHWKFSTSDLPERAFWADYMDAYEDALTATTTEEAPWYVVAPERS